MDNILKKLRYIDQERIAIINAPAAFIRRIEKLLPGVQIDTSINARYLYSFMVAFTPGSGDVKTLGPTCIHNLGSDGKLWMVYPKGNSKNLASDINRDRGWEPIAEAGFRAVSQVAVDNDWSALRFRNLKYVKSHKKES